MVRFIHTADWQLGIPLHRLHADARARYAAERFDAIRRIGKIAADQDAAFVVVAGDVFDKNLVDKNTVHRACDALESIPVPVFLLPGNHDCLSPSTVYRSRRWLDKKPDNVTVLENEAVIEAPGCEVLGAPWATKNLLEDPLKAALEAVPDRAQKPRILVGHGTVDAMMPGISKPDHIKLDAAEATIREGLIDFIALGDHHSVRDVGSTQRIWYSGTPVVTDFDEQEPNHVLVVNVDDEDVEVTPIQTSDWQFRQEAFQVMSQDDVDALRELIVAEKNKPNVVLKYSVAGTLNLEARATFDRLMDDMADRYAALIHDEGKTKLHYAPTEADLEALPLAGFAKQALEELLELARGSNAQTETASDAVLLLYQLAKEDLP